ncbi:hypothetical protein [Leptolyngbya sp. 7M]|nr:hypothetical protein [Leptolyngbya sp. 7M]QYO65899.1 hypothetical protein JVX88_03620 [Leptolyngbya sp. 7M]
MTDPATIENADRQLIAYTKQCRDQFVCPYVEPIHESDINMPSIYNIY